LRGENNEEKGADSAAYTRHIALTREMLLAERQAAIRLRNEGRINDEVLRKVEHELDLNEERLTLIQ
jgi:monovalent cation/hydrogen antiporter